MMKLLIAVFATSVVTNAFAGEADITLSGTDLKSVAIVGTATGGQAPGNMEVELRSPLTLPFGVNRDKNYITTKQSIDPDRTMTKMLLTAMGNPTYYSIVVRITDSRTVITYAGRCSLEIVRLQFNPLQSRDGCVSGIGTENNNKGQRERRYRNEAGSVVSQRPGNSSSAARACWRVAFDPPNGVEVNVRHTADERSQFNTRFRRTIAFSRFSPVRASCS